MLFEDAFVVRDRQAIAELFEDGAVLVGGGTPNEARGADAIGLVATQLWARDLTYLADPLQVLQARDTALVVARQGINVLRRGDDGAWRYAISLLAFGDNSKRQERT